MTPMHDASDKRQADELAVFGDALVDGYAPPGRTDIERTMMRAYRVSRAHNPAKAAMPRDVKNQIWKDLMELTAPSPAPSRPTATLVGTQRPAQPLEESISLGQRGSWQAVASFALMLAVLASLVSFLWYQGAGNHLGAPTPTTVAGQGVFDSDDPSTFPRVPETCIPNGEVLSDETLVNRSIDDWLTPAYGPAEAVSYEKGKAIQDTYLHYLSCEAQAFDQTFPPGSTPPVGAGTPVPPLEASPAMRTYFSERLRFDHMYGSLSAEQQADLDAWRCQPRVDRILETFPLPVNHREDYAVATLLANGDIDTVQSIFSPADIYLMPDGRYGTIIGTVTTAALDDPNAITSNDYLVFIAFVEEDGRYYIDETFTVLASGMDARFLDGRNGTILMNCD